MRRQTIVLAAVGVFLLVGLAWFLQHHYLEGADLSHAESSSPSAMTPGADADTISLDGSAPAVLTVVEPGTLERLNESGTWETLAAGDTLHTDDRIRTSGQGRAVIQAMEGSRVELVDDVDLSVEVLTRSLAEVELRRGRLRADMDDGSALALRIRSSGAVAEGRGGAFTVYADGDGMLAVASETASVHLRAQGEEVTVGAGQQAAAFPGLAPESPVDIPEEVFLDVAWPEKRLTREKQLVIRGAVTPGTEIHVDDFRTKVGPSGTFQAQVDLHDGMNKITVKARDPGGRVHTESSPNILVKSRPPRLEPVKTQIWDE